MVSMMMAVLLMSALVQQNVLVSWGPSGERSLSDWRLMGEPGVPVDKGVVVLRPDPGREPHSIISPRLDLPRVTFDTITLSYSVTPATADVTFVGGWIGSVISSEKADGCVVRVGALAPGSQTTEVSLAASPCWEQEHNVEELVLNFKATGPDADKTVLRIHWISLSKR